MSSPIPSRIDNRVSGLDYLRVVLALLIFFFHSRVHLGCDYGVMNDLISKASFAMTGFFILSGYSLQLAYRKKDMLDNGVIKTFYLKRLITIYPTYIFVGTLSVIMKIVGGLQTVEDNVILAPVELFGIQSFFDGALFGYAHNGGTWFISCLLICYFVFPLLKELFCKLSSRDTLFFIVFLVCLLSYIHLLPFRYDVGELYTNAYLRLLEFSLGILLANLNYGEWGEGRWMGLVRSWPILLFSLILLFIGQSWANRNGFQLDMLMYSCYVVIFLSLGINHPRRRRCSPKCLLYVSSLTYSFYLGQFLVWKPTKFLLLYTGQLSNIVLILGTFSACVILSLFLHEVIEKRLGMFLKNRLIHY